MEDVIDTIKASAERPGRRRIPTGTKWSFAAAQQVAQKYGYAVTRIEGDLGAFMDRSVLRDPTSLRLGGHCRLCHRSQPGFVYGRAEYPIAAERLSIAIEQAKVYGLIGKDIFRKGFDFDLEIVWEPALVCGEETARRPLSKGKRGELRRFQDCRSCR